MTIGTDLAVNVALGPLDGYMGQQSASDLSTTPVKIVFAGLNGDEWDLAKRVAKIKISNLHASNLIAWKRQTRGASAPLLNATAGHINAGVIIHAATAEYFTMPLKYDLWVVASGSSTSFQVSYEYD